jgi:IS5 family transposase
MKGGPPFAVETMPRIHFMPQWFILSDPAMEETLHAVPLLREFASLDWDRLPDESTILLFRHLLERHKLADQILTLVNDLLSSKGLLLKAGHGGRCHADRCTEFDQEQGRAGRP